jgi:hypothetical protein
VKGVWKQAISFYLLTLVLSWGYWLTLLGHGVKVDRRMFRPLAAIANLPGLPLNWPLTLFAVLVPLFWLITGMAAMVGPMMFGWFFALVCGAFVLAMVYLATGHSILCVALWHVTFNMMVSGPVDTELLSVLVSAGVMLWGLIIAVLWWRKPKAI